MGYALPSGGRGGGLGWVVAAAAVALAVGHVTGLPALRPPLAATARAAPQARPVRVVYRDADGRWRVRVAGATGVWRTASIAAWRRAMPGMRVRRANGGVELTETPGLDADPFYLGVDRGRVAIWAGRPHAFSVRLATTPLLAGALGPGDLARLQATVRVPSVAGAWRVLSRLGA